METVQVNSAVGIAAITGGNVPIRIAQWDIPFIWAATGSMGNNGAITLGTALPRIIDFAYVLLPAGAIAAGVPAALAWYYTEFSSTTVGTVFNNTYSSGIPAAPVSKTAFVTTGPGAFTGDTTNQNGPVITMAANAMGLHGKLVIDSEWEATNNANAKTCTIMFGAGTAWSGNIASNATYIHRVPVRNMGSAAVQALGPSTGNYTGYGGGTVALVRGTVDTTAAVNITWQGNHSAAATDNIILDTGAIFAYQGVS